MSIPFDPQNRTTSPLRHKGACGPRGECWRADCRAAFPGLRTVEILPDGERIAYCHRSRFYPVAFRAEVAA